MLRKGTIQDSFFIILVAFSIAVVVVFAQFILTEFQAANTVLPSFAFTSAETALSVYNLGFVLIVGVLYMVSIVFAFRIRTSAFFFFASFILNGIALYLSAEFANVFWKLVNATTGLAQAANNFPALVQVMKNFPIIVGVLNTVLIIALFVTPRRVGGRVSA